MRRARIAVALVLALLVAACAVGVATAETQPSKAQSPSQIQASKKLRRAVEPAGILVHERRFQRIANANGGTRASGTPGYEASVAYVAAKLQAAGYKVRRQTFEFPYFDKVSQSFSQTSPEERSFEPYDLATQSGDYDVMTYSGSGALTDASVVPTNDVEIPPSPTPGSDSGCEPEDFEPAGTAPQVALVQRGTCDFVVKARTTQEAGYDAAILFNEGQAGRQEVLAGTLGAPGIEIPVIGISYELGRQLYEAADPRVSLDVETDSEVRETSNVIADTPRGRVDRTVVVGAHLDYVPEGPGINDNASGSAAVLEIAEELAAADAAPRNRVRFAFWGAEELGLLGSRHYVDGLGEDELEDIAVYLNLDMIGSPNFVRTIYDGPDEVEDAFSAYFGRRGIATAVTTALDGRSDHGPFQDAGVPTGGLFSGAGGRKTEGQAEEFGGRAGRPYDPCYHRACDDADNVSARALDQLADGVAHVTGVMAERDPALNRGGPVE